MQIFYDKDCDLSIIQSKKVAIIGYGSQGHAHALNLKDSGVDVTVGLRAGSTSWKKAENSGLKVAEVPAAVAQADVVMILTPDEFQSQLYRDVIEPNIKQGATLAFAHGFAGAMRGRVRCFIMTAEAAFLVVRLALGLGLGKLGRLEREGERWNYRFFRGIEVLGAHVIMSGRLCRRSHESSEIRELNRPSGAMPRSIPARPVCVALAGRKNNPTRGENP